MALLDRKLKQRIVGAAVLVALVVVFLPMLFNREDEQRRVRVDAPPMPTAPQVAMSKPEPVATPEPAVAPAPPQVSSAAVESPVRGEVPAREPAASRVPVARETPPRAPQAPEAAAAEPSVAPGARLDSDGLPVTWSIQLVSLSSRPRAEELQKKLRGQGLTAYIRSVDGMHRVFVGPLLDRAEAERVGGQLARQHKLSPIVVRFQPEAR